MVWRGCDGTLQKGVVVVVSWKFNIGAISSSLSSCLRLYLSAIICSGRVRAGVREILNSYLMKFMPACGGKGGGPRVRVVILLAWRCRGVGVVAYNVVVGDD